MHPSILPTHSEVNQGLKPRISRVRSLNGRSIHNLQHLTTMVESEQQGEGGGWLDLELEDSAQQRISLHLPTARRADFDIFRRYRIPFYRQQSVEEKGARPETRAKEKERVERSREAFRQEAAERGWTQFLRVGIMEDIEDDDEEGGED